MKYARYFLLIIGLLFIIENKVLAETYNCYYAVDGQEIKMIVDTDKKVVTANGGILTTEDFLLDSYIDSNWTDKKLIDEYIKGKCPSVIYGCQIDKVYRSASGERENTTKIYLPLINSNLVEKIPVKRQKIKEKGSDTYYFTDTKKCQEATYKSDKSDKDVINLTIPCDGYDNRYEELKKIVCTNTEDMSSCSIKKAQGKQSYYDLKNELKEYCSIKLKYSSYHDNCVKSCLSLSSDIAKIENNDSVLVAECGFSGELMAWIRNIIKYAKYFLPVIVIVLGILDFISAIASNKDEDIKKAQDKFVKRLISAALVFLVPLIIGFILDQFGFTTEYCGVFK